MRINNATVPQTSIIVATLEAECSARSSSLAGLLNPNVPPSEYPLQSVLPYVFLVRVLAEPAYLNLGPLEQQALLVLDEHVVQEVLV